MSPAFTVELRGHERHGMSESALDATRVLTAHSAGDRNATAQLIPLVYKRLRALAGHYMGAEAGYQTLQPTALVHEAFIRMIKSDAVDWRGKTHFFAVAATQMRRILIDRARAAASQKRGLRPTRITLNDTAAVTQEGVLDLLMLDEAMGRLARRSNRQARVAELRVFSGMQFEEIAHILGMSERTIRKDWGMARAWLSRELGSGERAQ